jgi:hypothetical protein
LKVNNLIYFVACDLIRSNKDNEDSDDEKPKQILKEEISESNDELELKSNSNISELIKTTRDRLSLTGKDLITGVLNIPNINQ